MRPDVATLAADVVGGDRSALARAITLVESTQPAHFADADALLDAILPHSGSATRVGITGVPGVGKSTFIERLGCARVAEGKRVAVLAVDPSSQRGGGSILGDKTRMDLLAASEHAFIRPSPSGGSLGGVHRKTREAMLLCEAAGYDLVLVETVGVGQSETAVAAMVDTFCVLMLPGAGDELQGIKRGILELADLVIVHKADGERMGLAHTAARDLRAALRLFASHGSVAPTRVVLASSASGDGVEAVWAEICAHRAALCATKEPGADLQARRAQQQVAWMWSIVDDAARSAVRGAGTVRAAAPALEAAVRAGKTAPTGAARQLLALAANANVKAPPSSRR